MSVSSWPVLEEEGAWVVAWRLVCMLVVVCIRVAVVSVAVCAGGMGVLGGFAIHLVSSVCVDLRCPMAPFLMFWTNMSYVWVSLVCWC